MQVPILKQGSFLIASIQSAVNDKELVHLRNDLVAQVNKFRARGVVVDVTLMDVLDSFATRTLRDLALVIRLRGAETVIVGIQPELAIGLMQLGADFGPVETALDLEEGIALLQQRTR